MSKPIASNDHDSTPDTEVGAGATAPDHVRVLRQFRIITNAVRSHFRLVEKHAGISGAQAWALAVVAETPGLSVREVAIRLDIHTSTASNLLKSLATRSLISIARSAQDRRATCMEVTAEGIALLQRIPVPAQGVLPGALAALDPQVLARLENDLSLVVKALQADTSAAATLLADM